jgi:hypothetical protein
MMRRLLARRASLASIVGLAVALAWLPARAAAPADQAAEVAAATEQAAHWLDALDAGHYDEGWNSLAGVMKQGRTEQDWTADVSAPREQFGKPIMRELQRAEFSTVVRGAPTGNYVTASYLSQFTNAPPVLEMILLTLEDGHWRIAGYSAGAAPDAPNPAAPADKAPAGAPGG